MSESCIYPRASASRPSVLRWIAAMAALGLPLIAAPHHAAAQELHAISTPRGVEVRIVDMSYGIQGSTARQLFDQLRGAEGLASFPYEYRWRYQTRRLPSVTGGATLHCAVSDITIEFTVRASYPRWENRPPDASAELLDAWSVFEERLEARWRERQDAMVSFAREARREVLRIQEGCGIIRQIVNDRVQRAHDRSVEREREAAAEGERTRLGWPPEGYEGLMTVTSAGAPPPGSSTTAGPEGRAASSTGARRPPPLPAPGSGAPVGGVMGIERALDPDVGPEGMLGAVAGLSMEGEIDYLGAVGFADPEREEPLTPETRARLSGLTEVIVSTVATALEGEGVLDLSAAIGSYDTGLDPALGAITLRDLLTHRSGLDDARPADSVWSTIVDELDRRAVMTGAGTLFSYSRYDYPVAIRVLESGSGASLGVLADRLVFGPAGMERTALGPDVDGVPVTLTTIDDLMALGDAIMAGTVSVQPPEEVEARWSEAERAGGTYYGGLRWDTPAGVRRMTQMCEAGSGTDAFAYQLYPEEQVVQVLWARPGSSAAVWPQASARLVLQDLGGKLGLGPAVFEPRRLQGAADLQPDPTRCDEPGWNQERVSQVDDPVAPGSWVGRYLNGDRRVTLEERDGGLWVTDDIPLRIHRYDDQIHLATMNGLALYPLRLLTDADGRRYVVLHGRAHIHDEDRNR